MKKMLLGLLAGALLLGTMGLRSAEAESLKPVAVLSLAGYDEVMRDVAFVGKLADRPELDKVLEGLLAMVTQGKGLAGIDKARPWGAVVGADGDAILGYGFLPITSLKQVLSLIEPIADVKKGDNGVYQITPRNQPKSFFVKEQGGWAFTAEKAEILGRVTANPMTLLAGLNKEYLLGARIFAANVPAKIRGQLIAAMKAGVERDHPQRPGESADDFAARRKAAQQGLAILEDCLNDLDQVTVGWMLDRDAEKTYVDLSVTAKAGTATAGQFDAMKTLTSSFLGFRLPGATMTGNWTGTLSEKQKALLDVGVSAFQKHSIRDIEQSNKPADEQKLAKEIVDSLVDMAEKTIKSGRYDGGMTVVLQPQVATVLAGGYLAETAQLDKILRTFGDILRSQHPQIADWITFDAATQADVKLHTVSIPIPPETNDREKAVALLGEKLEVVVGLGKESIYVAAGRNAMETLTKAIQTSVGQAKAVAPPAQFSVALEPLMRTAATFGKEQDRAKAKIAADELKKQPAGSDHITLIARPVSNGVTYRLEVEKGVLKGLGHTAVMSQQKSW